MRLSVTRKVGLPLDIPQQAAYPCYPSIDWPSAKWASRTTRKPCFQVQRRSSKRYLPYPYDTLIDSYTQYSLGSVAGSGGPPSEANPTPRIPEKTNVRTVSAEATPSTPNGMLYDSYINTIY